MTNIKPVYDQCMTSVCMTSVWSVCVWSVCVWSVYVSGPGVGTFRWCVYFCLVFVKFQVF